MTRAFTVALMAGVVAMTPNVALAWGTTGHREINFVAMRSLPPDVPAFLQNNQTAVTIEALGPEEDRLKGAGFSWDRDSDPAHYVDVGDDGTIGGTIGLRRLPADMEEYASALAFAGSNPYRVGYLPYAIADGLEQLRKDFAYWRVFDYLERHATRTEARAAFAAERELREALVVHDIGVWGHFVGDGSQPLHVSVHYNGWGNYANPNHYTDEHIHAMFEGAFVRNYVHSAAVGRLIHASGNAAPDHLLTQAEILSAVGTYLSATSSFVPRLYDIERRNGFRAGSPEAVEFVTARVADGAQELRDLVVLAWRDSRYESVGYPEIPVQDILTGKVVPEPSAFGGD